MILLRRERRIVPRLLLRLHRIIAVPILEMIDGIIGLESSRASFAHEETSDENDCEHKRGDPNSYADSSAETRGVVVALAEVRVVLLSLHRRRREQHEQEGNFRLDRHHCARKSSVYVLVHWAYALIYRAKRRGGRGRTRRKRGNCLD